MAVLKSFVVCFLMLPLSVACANQTVYHTMLYVKILNYTNTGILQRSGGNMPVSTSGSGGNMPVSTSGSDSCCYKMPLQNCAHFCKTVFSICIESKCDTYLFNITYNYDTGRIYDENYGVERLNVQSIRDQTINIDVTEVKTNIRTGLTIESKIDSFATKYSRPPSGSFWLSRMFTFRLQNNASSIDLQKTAFCESNWYDPRQHCSENIPTNNLQSVHYNFRNRTFDAELDCTTEETSKITFITKRPYKFTKQILEAQLSRFIADRVCSSIAKDVSIQIQSVRYDSNLLRVVFSSHCNLRHSSLLSIAKKFIEVSDLKLMQALMFLSSYEERQYFIDPVLRDDFSNAHNLGNFQLLLRLKRFENPNNIYFTNDFRGLTKQNCPARGCTPSFHFTYQGVEHTLRKHSPATNLMDCFGNLVDELNPTEKTNNTLFWHSSKTWNTHDLIKLEIYQNDNNKELIAIMDIKLDNVDVVSSSYLLARPIIT
ncbi:uncharacterized protein LOC132738056 [Ruditapes philippinarum]|uniref:uncharacterized protein LOC132738056 n=1 Tax=Ruditapes philippinarum TaxID=129788 RepID=UPI00295C2867|nr:uncharacterized protein LOC132738056 [Ruditapes philippinarum]